MGGVNHRFSMENNQYTFTKENLKSIAIGALINLAGTALLTIGLFLQNLNFTAKDFGILGFALLGNLGAVIVNTVRKYISAE